MKYTTLLILSTILCFSFTSCSSGEDASETENKTKSEDTAGWDVPDSPCEIINANDIRDLLKIDAEFEIDMQEKNYTYPACSFRWEDGKVVNSTEIGGRIMDFEAPSEVMVVLAKDTDESKYERSIKVYHDAEPVSSVGDRAVWGTEMEQLTFQKDELLFHIHVKMDNMSAVNREAAIKIAEFILGKI